MWPRKVSGCSSWTRVLRIEWGHCHFRLRWAMLRKVSWSKATRPLLPWNRTGLATRVPLSGSLKEMTVLPIARSSSSLLPTCHIG